jgi:hypothetical protein
MPSLLSAGGQYVASSTSSGAKGLIALQAFYPGVLGKGGHRAKAKSGRKHKTTEGNPMLSSRAIHGYRPLLSKFQASVCSRPGRGTERLFEGSNQVRLAIGLVMQGHSFAEVTEIFSRIANPMTTTARTRKGNMPASKASASANALLSNLDF